ncbi:MAG: FAD-dependent monooxygenase [Reichenbachiella sp.]|uniref:FAD-dependent monooxygenase n=1 Tax=Reichenbachiella sp. TaxID=2184521 RepID=UPI003265FFB4
MKFTIVGGGISGLTTALAFEKLGVEYELYEAAPALNELGAGIWMASNAMQVFGWLGIADEVQGQGMSLEHVEVADQSFRTINTTDQQIIVDALGYSIVSIHRARLQKILFNQLPAEKIHLGMALESIDQEDEKVTANFKDGSTVISNALIAADGIHSVVRNQLFPHSVLRYSGQTCWRGIAKLELPEKLSRSCVETWGNRVRFGISVIGENEVYWFAVAEAASGGKDNQKNLKSKLKQMFKDFAEPVQSILEATPSEKIIRSDISDLKPLDAWSDRRVVLIGDAGHATTPNMGQGGAQGVEDAYYLGQIIKRESDPVRSFQIFEKTRKKKVNQIVSGSRNVGRLAHIEYGRSIRNFLMRMVPPAMTNRQMIKLYSIQEFE